MCTTDCSTNEQIMRELELDGLVTVTIDRAKAFGTWLDERGIDTTDLRSEHVSVDGELCVEIWRA